MSRLSPVPGFLRARGLHHRALMFRRILASCLALLPLTACGSSPSGPSDTGSTVLHGQTISAINGAPAPNLSVQVGTRSANSDANGMFEFDAGNQGTLRAVVRGGGVVERETHVSVPRNELLRVSMIPSAFDLNAFDEMFRASNARLQRWTARPSLVLLATVMEYRASSGETYTAGSEQLTDDEVAAMREHLTEGLAMLTGNTYTSFASVDVQRPAEGTRVDVLEMGKIFVGRYNGIVTFARTIGYGQWAELADGTVSGGAMYLDRDFDRNDSRRRLLRIHELGHALGLQHVQLRTSIMNPSIGPEPTTFDREAAMIGFQRPVGNKSPDVDPSTSTLGISTGQAVWKTACRP
jgi:hypothetical protein